MYSGIYLCLLCGRWIPWRLEKLPRSDLPMIGTCHDVDCRMEAAGIQISLYREASARVREKILLVEEAEQRSRMEAWLDVP